ncbi:MAG: hypothetical protein RIQ64_1070, partial [Actinomycetota bacterium]
MLKVKTVTPRRSYRTALLATSLFNKPVRAVALGLISLLATTVLVDTLAPQPVSAGLDLTVPSLPQKISAGENFVCLYDGSSVKCAGRNDQGQLGDGTNTDRKYLAAISTITNVSQLAVGANHACVVADGQKVYCWGDNQYGQLGDGTTTDRSTPTLVVDNGSFTNSMVRGLVAGENHTCAIVPGIYEKLHCWGRNNMGQLGDGTQVNRLVPTSLAAPFDSTGVVPT